MVTMKRCTWGTSKNDSHYPQRMIKNLNGDLVTFLIFPGQKRMPKSETAQRSNDSLYICRFCRRESPIPATQSKELVRFLCFSCVYL